MTTVFKRNLVSFSALLILFLPFIFQTIRAENAQLLEQKDALEQENNEVLSV